ncbi:hypothetical protein M9Y10_044226 [Tritrichomonas musculus]|uniref:Uncharacterized protein n=1 Tax=Tritrichomonas musculus TaxID=1915356 RepID=A0ABR2K1X3_9EUKA
MNYGRSDSFDNYDAFDNISQYPSQCPWCNPCKINVQVETCFIPPKVQERAAPLPIPTSKNSGEKLKRCDFEYFPGTLFKQKIKVH